MRRQPPGVTFSLTSPPFLYAPLLWRLTGLQLTSTVKVTKLTGTVFTFTVGHKTFTVGDETYRPCPVCTYLSFITDCKSFVTDCKSYATDCKSENSACKFCQLLQSVTIARVAIRLTVTRGGGDWNRFHTPPRGRTKSIFLFSFTPPPGAYEEGGKWKRFTGTHCSPRYSFTGGRGLGRESGIALISEICSQVQNCKISNFHIFGGVGHWPNFWNLFRSLKLAKSQISIFFAHGVVMFLCSCVHNRRSPLTRLTSKPLHNVVTLQA